MNTPAVKRPNERIGCGSMIRGMTGFGRAQGQAPWGAWVWEARSVNGKSVDLRTNFPPGCEPVDFEARRRVKERFQRGSFQLQLKNRLDQGLGRQRHRHARAGAAGAAVALLGEIGRGAGAL